MKHLSFSCLLNTNILNIPFNVFFRRSLPSHTLYLGCLPTGHGMLKRQQLLDEVGSRRHDDNLGTRRWGGSWRRPHVHWPTRGRTGACRTGHALEGERSVVSLVQHTFVHYPILPTIDECQGRSWLVEISPTTPIFVDEKQER